MRRFSFRVYSGTCDIGRLFTAYGCTAVQLGSDRFPRSEPVWPGQDKRPQQDSNLRSRLRRQLLDCLTACVDRSPRGLLVHIWSADPQPLGLSAWELACYAPSTTAFATQSLFALSVSARERPSQTVPSARNGHAGRGLFIPKPGCVVGCQRRSARSLRRPSIRVL
jgi:hypothetical protein